MKKLDTVTSVFVLIGAFNWGLVGFFNLNAIDLVFENPLLDRFAYAAISLAALYKVIYWNAIKKRWKD